MGGATAGSISSSSEGTSPNSSPGRCGLTPESKKSEGSTSELSSEVEVLDDLFLTFFEDLGAEVFCFFVSGGSGLEEL